MITIKTDQPILKNREKMNQTIAKFWNKTSYGWQEVWGPHIHHGFYEHSKEATPLQAQEILIEKLAQELQLSDNCKVLDVGCGMGGSSLYLAENYKATVNGISLSQTQVEIARNIAQDKKIKQVNFQIEDALSLRSFAHDSFDIIWSLESCEQFTDKKLFLEKAFYKLKSGGKLLLVTWCSSEEQYHGLEAKKYKKLCLAFDVPYMPTMDHYHYLLTKQGFKIEKSFDWTNNVKQSWDLGVRLIRAYSFLKILKLAGWRGFRFSKQLRLMQDAFSNNRIKYGVFVAIKP